MNKHSLATYVYTHAHAVLLLLCRLRFDFSNNGPVDTAKLAQIEGICRDWVTRALPVSSKEVGLTDAKAINGLRAVFGEVYPDPVRYACQVLGLQLYK